MGQCSMRCRSSITSRSRDERAAAAHPRRERAADACRRARRASCRGSPRDLARAAHGGGEAGRAVVIAADEAAMRALADTVPLFAPEVRGADPAGLGLPALRPRLAGAAGDGRAAGDAQRAAAAAEEAAAAGRHRQRRDPAGADPVPRPPADPPHRRGRADRPRSADRAADRARLPAHRLRRRAWRICGSRVADRPVPVGRDRRALRLDFFGDEIESLRRFDPADQRSTGTRRRLHC